VVRHKDDPCALADSTSYRTLTYGPRSAAAALFLVFYPEHLIRQTGTPLLTVVVGALLLFAPIRPILGALVPMNASRSASEPADGRRRWLRRAC